MIELSSKKSEKIFEEIYELLVKENLLHKLIAIGTDGEAAVRSVKNGVTGKFKEKLPYVLDFHCIAHKLSLGVKDLVKKDKNGKCKFPELLKMNEFVYHLCSEFRASYKR